MTCGDIVYFGKDSKGCTFPIRESCKKWTCLRCHPKLVHKEANVVDLKMNFARGEYGKMSHVEISFRKIEGRSEAVKWLKKVGLSGGSLCEHRPQTARTGQHFHTIAFGQVDYHHVKHIGLGKDFKCKRPGCQLPHYKHERGKIVIKRLSRVTNVFKAARYELGHIYNPDSRKAVSWWGVVSSKKLEFKKIEKEGKGGKIRKCWPTVTENCLCPRCKIQLYKVFDRKDPIEQLYCPLSRKIRVLELEWKSRYKQDVL